MLKRSSEYFMYTDIQAYNNALFAKCTTITQMNFLPVCNDVNCRHVTVFQAILRHNPEQKNTDIYRLPACNPQIPKNNYLANYPLITATCDYS